MARAVRSLGFFSQEDERHHTPRILVPLRLISRQNERGEDMKRFGIALLLALVAFGGVGVAWAGPDGTSIGSVQAP